MAVPTMSLRGGRWPTWQSQGSAGGDQVPEIATAPLGPRNDKLRLAVPEWFVGDAHVRPAQEAGPDSPKADANWQHSTAGTGMPVPYGF